MSELVPLNILIADRTYRIKTSPADEEHVRKTVKLINDKILEFKKQYAGKDMQDYIAMVIIWFATQSAAQAAEIGPVSEIAASLLAIEDQVDRLLV
jgi:cell division protein ZapA